jgi:hypothetical protein
MMKLVAIQGIAKSYGSIAALEPLLHALQDGLDETDCRRLDSAARNRRPPLARMDARAGIERRVSGRMTEL